MAKLSNAEKKQLLRFAGSAKLRDNFAQIKKRSKALSKGFSADDYIRFVTFSNRFFRISAKFLKK